MRIAQVAPLYEPIPPTEYGGTERVVAHLTEARACRARHVRKRSAAMDELDEIARFEIQEGWDVVDADDQLIGKVSEVHTESFTVETTTGDSREISFTDVESADDGRVALVLSGEELTSDLDG